MAGRFSAIVLIVGVVAFLSTMGYVKCNPAIAVGYGPMDVCIENCAQCRKMLGPIFEGPLCAQSCIEIKGKFILDCENYSSIKPFLNKL